MKRTVQLIKILMITLIFSFHSCIPDRSGGRKTDTDTELITQNVFFKPTVNVYIENSASMDGYVKGITEFELAVYSYLSDIKIADVTDALNLFYINSETIPYATIADIDVISDFIEKLEPNEFKRRGGNRATTDISNIIKDMLSETDENDVAVLVTDGIFSPGRGKDAAEYLVNQQIGIKNTIAGYLKKYPNTSITVYQLSSKFTSNVAENIYYYNREDKKIIVNDQRPYYIWVIGNINNIALLKASIPEKKFKGGGIKNSYTLLPFVSEDIDYAILSNPKIGEFKRNKNNPKTSIYDLKIAQSGAHKGNFMFTIGMDLSYFSILLGDEYLMNTENYVRLINKQPNNSYYIEIEQNTNPSSKYTHNMKLTTNQLSYGELEIALRNQIPQWAYDINDEEGLDIFKGSSINQTFGFKFLVEGIYEGFISQGNEFYSVMKLNLKK